MKRVNISSPTGQKIGSFTAFKEIQALFGLHPLSIIDNINLYAKQNGLDRKTTAKFLSAEVQSVFPQYFEKTLDIIKGKPIVKEQDVHCAKACSEFLGAFGLRPQALADTINEFARQVGDVSPLVVADEFFSSGIPKVLQWAFTETKRILEKYG